jgi:hypothetical protein
MVYAGTDALLYGVGITEQAKVVYLRLSQRIA